MQFSNSKKVILFILSFAVVCIAFKIFAVWHDNSVLSETAYAQSSETKLTMQINNPMMTVNGEEREIDPGRGTSPIVVNNRTLVPIRAIIEALGGNVTWNEESQTVSLEMNENSISLVINSEKATVNNEEKTLDVAPVVINDRTMLPIRFIAESFNFDVNWNQKEQLVTITEKTGVEENPDNIASNLEYRTTDANAPVVFMTTEITPDALAEIYSKLEFQAEGNVAVKMSTGEPPNSNYLRPELIKDLIQSVNGTIVECNTAYGGSRSSTTAHKQVARDHGFYDIAEVDIMDEDDSMEIPIADGTRIHENYVGSHLANYDSLISLAHFKGHAMAGYGGAIKNMSIGIASSDGKRWIHTGGESMDTWMGSEQDAFLEAMADATSGVVDYLDGKVVYINVMNRLSVDCDCDGNPSEPDLHDIGILASYDPVALDQACLDLIYAQRDGDGSSLVQRIESRNGLHTLEQAEKIGLGSRTYRLVSMDE